jgi:hypothetical protein
VLFRSEKRREEKRGEERRGELGMKSLEFVHISAEL